MATWAARHAIRGTVSGSSPAYSGSSLGLALSASPFGPSVVKKRGGVISPFSAPPTPPETPTKKIGPKKNADACVDLPEYLMAANGELPSVVNRLGNLLDTGQFADVNIRVGTGTGATVFKAHRLLLATASQPLYQLVYTVNPAPSSNDITTIRVTDVDPQAFGVILRYIYTDSVVIKSVKDAFDVMKAGKKWGLKGLGDRSLEYLSSILDKYDPSSEQMKNNLFDLLVVGEEKGMQELTEKCWGLITRHCNDVIPCEGFLNLKSDLVLRVVGHKDLKMKDQLKFFEAIRDWGVRQVHAKSMSDAELNCVLEKLIKYVDFTQIEDSDMVLTVLPSQCMGKAEIISFFMTRGLEIPKNLEYNNNNNNNNNNKLPFWLSFFTNSDKGKENAGTDAKTTPGTTNNTKDGLPRIAQMKPGKVDVEVNGTKMEGNKVNRFRKGFLVPKDEITTEHELRFRVDKNIKLLGVGFGFLFSATDMGVTIHCQGPWERVQWSDIMKTYCRVSGEKMQTADVRLMFAAPVKIEADQSYKILVKIGRMSAGNSEVELWGGSDGKLHVETEDAEFYFISAAVDPARAPTEAEGDVKNGIITELIYVIDRDEVKPAGTLPRRRRPQEDVEETETVERKTSPVRKQQYGSDQVNKPKPSYNWMRVQAAEEEEQKPPETPTTVRSRARNLGSEDYSGFGRWRKTSTGDDRNDTRPTTRPRATAETSYPSSPYLRRRFDATSPTTSSDSSRRVTENQDSTSDSYNVRSRLSTTTTPSSSDSRPSRDTTTRSRFLRDSTLTSLRTRDSSATRPSTYSSSTIRDSSTSRPRDYSSTRIRDSSASRPSLDSSATRTSTYTSSRLRDSSTSRVRDSSTSRYGSGLSSTLGTGTSSYASKYGTTTSSVGSAYTPSSARFGSGGASRFSTSYSSFSRYR